MCWIHFQGTQNTLLLVHFLLRVATFSGDHAEVGVTLISTALRFGLKDCGSLRKQARFLLESAVQKLWPH